jgi:hypothetical protein
MARFNIGGVCNINNNELLFIYPSEYKIYKYNKDLELEKIYEPKNSSRYFPKVAKFPNDLSPFEYGRAHKKWWGGFLHPISIFYLKNDFILVLLHEIDEFGEYKNYLNIHDLSGKTYTTGLRVPFNGFIRYVKNEYIYIDENVTSDNSVDYKLKLHVFKLNTSFLKKH